MYVLLQRIQCLAEGNNVKSLTAPRTVTDEAHFVNKLLKYNIAYRYYLAIDSFIIVLHFFNLQR